MTFIDWFAGIGGFRKGLELAGHKCIGFCEYDKYAVASYTSMHLIIDEQRQKLAEMPLKQRQKEILKDEYRNGEWYAPDIRCVRAADVPRADIWTFGAPCQDFSIAGKRAGLDGDRSSLVREIFRLVRDTRNEDKPEWLIYENVKGMLSSNRGFDYLAILLEMEQLGYDIEWRTFNSKNHGVPQNRERVYTIGHLRARGRKQIFPLESADGKDSTCEVKQIGQRDRKGRANLNQYRVYSGEGIAPCLNKMDGGGREPCIGIDYNVGGELRNIANTLTTRNNVSGVTNVKQDGTAVAIIDPQGRSSKACTPSDTASTLRAQTHGNEPCVVLPVLTPERPVKRQNGRRFKDNGEESFTLTSQDRPGVAISTVKAPPPVVWYEKYKCYIAIRKLTPKECFRLQGWTDDYFEKAKFVNSDSQLYKQAGNGVTVNVVECIGRLIK